MQFPPSPGSTLAEARRAGTARLRAISGDEADLDARILLQGATGFDRFRLLNDEHLAIEPHDATRYASFLERRVAGEPVWRILGEREFWGLSFEITPDVLDPRPDTETLIAAALASVDRRRAEPLRLLDLGTGSGAILCALCHELTAALGCGVDRSEAACRVASRNVARNGLSARTLVSKGDWGAAFSDHRFDLVVSNPPYIETGVIPTLSREVRDFDPLPALDGGADGLDCYRAIIADLPRLLAPGGTVVLEVGWTQAEAVESLLRSAGLIPQEPRRDLGGHIRALVAVRG